MHPGSRLVAALREALTRRALLRRAVAAGALVTSSLSAMPPVSVRAAPAAHSPAADVDALAAELDALIPERLARHRIPGAAVALVSAGEVAWARGYGLADKESGTPI